MVQHINSWWCPYVSVVKCCTGVWDLTIWRQLSFKEKSDLNPPFHYVLLHKCAHFLILLFIHTLGGSSAPSRRLTHALESLLQSRRRSPPPQKHTSDSVATQIYEFYIPLRSYMAMAEQGHDKRCWSISEWKTIWEVFKAPPPPLCLDAISARYRLSGAVVSQRLSPLTNPFAACQPPSFPW